MPGTLTSPQLTAADRCDRCGAGARVRAVLPTGGELLFCGHHATEHADRSALASPHAVRVGMPASAAAFFALALSPSRAMDSAAGPTNVRPAATTASAKSESSERNP